MVEYRPAQNRLCRGVDTSRGFCSASSLPCDEESVEPVEPASDEAVGMAGSVVESVSPMNGRGRHDSLVESSLGRGIALDDLLDCSVYFIDPYTSLIRAGVGG